MKIFIFTDTHGVEKIQAGNPDIVFLLGDIDYFELRKIDKMFSCPKFGVLGNHDAPDFFNDTSIINLHGKVLKWKGYTLAGFGGSPVYKRKSFGQYSDDECNEFMTTVPKVDFFLAHSNPAWEISFDETDAHRGFLSFADYITSAQPKHFFHGHVHKEKEQKIKDTIVHSVYPFKEINL